MGVGNSQPEQLDEYLPAMDMDVYTEPPPPPETEEERMSREDREFEQQMREEEEADARADEAANRAEEKESARREREDTRERKKLQREADRLLRERNKAEALNEEQGFRKRPADKPLELSVSNSADCSSCTLKVDQTLSSATVILSRNVLGATTVPPVPMPPSNLPRGARNNPGFHDHGNHKHEYFERDMYGRAMSLARDGSTLYSPPYPGSAFPEVLSAAETQQLSGGTMGQVEFAKKWSAQVREEHANKQKIKAQNALAKKRVYLWNPSDPVWLKGGSHELNWNNHGALTKLYVKPTIPFKVSFDTVGSIFATQATGSVSMFSMGGSSAPTFSFVPPGGPDTTKKDEGEQSISGPAPYPALQTPPTL
jgi:hypothetical protein